MKSDKFLKGIAVFAVVLFCFTLNASAAWKKKEKKVTEETKTEAVVPAVQETAPAPAQVATPPRAVILPPGFNPNPPANMGKPMNNPANTALPPGFNPPGYSGSLAAPVAAAANAEAKAVPVANVREEVITEAPAVEEAVDMVEEEMTETDYAPAAEETDEYDDEYDEEAAEEDEATEE